MVILQTPEAQEGLDLGVRLVQEAKAIHSAQEEALGEGKWFGKVKDIDYLKYDTNKMAWKRCSLSKRIS